MRFSERIVFSRMKNVQPPRAHFMLLESAMLAAGAAIVNVGSREILVTA